MIAITLLNKSIHNKKDLAKHTDQNPISMAILDLP